MTDLKQRLDEIQKRGMAACGEPYVLATLLQAVRIIEAVELELKACGHPHEGMPLHILVDRAIDAEREKVSALRNLLDEANKKAQAVYPAVPRHDRALDRSAGLIVDERRKGGQDLMKKIKGEFVRQGWDVDGDDGPSAYHEPGDMQVSSVDIAGLVDAVSGEPVELVVKRSPSFSHEAVVTFHDGAVLDLNANTIAYPDGRVMDLSNIKIGGVPARDIILDQVDRMTVKAGKVGF